MEMMALKVVALEEALELVTLDLEIAREQSPGAYSLRSAHSSICQIQYLENCFLQKNSFSKGSSLLGPWYIFSKKSTLLILPYTASQKLTLEKF